MKTIAIYVASIELGGPTFENQTYWQAYLELLLMLQNRGVNAFFVTGMSTYLGEGKFTCGYTMFRQGPPDKLIRFDDITADLVFDRAGFPATDVFVINPPELYHLGDNKILMHEKFGQYQPVSVMCRNVQELTAAFGWMETQLVVAKDPLGWGGGGVFIGTPGEVLEKARSCVFPLLAQEFMDTSVGIPGLAQGIHDMRLVFVGGDIVSCDIRTPRAGEYRANVAQGGSVRYIPLARIPRAAARLAQRIDESFAGQPRFYAVDLANTPSGWKLIELNSRVGLVRASYGKENAYVSRRLTDYLVELARRPAHAAVVKSANEMGYRLA